jgi:hypothetical protein
MMEILNILVTSQKEMVDAHRHMRILVTIRVLAYDKLSCVLLDVTQWHTLLLWI